jgi:hypothetical protein
MPGPVDRQQFSGSFGIDGILEGLVHEEMVINKSYIFGEHGLI